MKKTHLLFLAAVLMNATACSGITTVQHTDGSPERARMDRDSNADSPQATPAPTLTQPPALSQTQEEEQEFARALKLMDEAAFGDASLALEHYLNDYPTSPKRGEALFELSLCYLNLDQTHRALQKIHWLLDDRYYGGDKDLQVRARLVEAEIYLRMNRADEALAATFELLPANRNERHAGFATSGQPQHDLRLQWTSKLTAMERARTKALRGRIFGELGRTDLAEAALRDALALMGRRKTAETRFLRGQIAMYRIEILEKNCQSSLPLSNPLSEQGALDYIDSYYRCADPARRYFCDVGSARDAGLQTRALRAYQTLATFPMTEADHLPPPPPRPVRTEQERKFFEQELQKGFRSWTQDHIKDFRDLDACKMENIF